MAVTVPNASNAIEGLTVTTATSSPTWTSNKSNLLVAGHGSWGATAAGTVNDGGTDTWVTSSSAAVSGHGTNFGQMSYAKSIAGKAGQAVTLTINAAQFPSIALLEAAGIDPVSPVDVAPSFTSVAGVSGTSVASTLITPTAGLRLLVFCGVTDTGAPVQAITDAGSAAASWTTVKSDNSSGEPILFAYAIVTADGSHTYGVTYANGGTGGALIACIAAFKAQLPAPEYRRRPDPWGPARVWAALR